MLCDGWGIFKEGLWAEIIKEEPVYEWQYVFYNAAHRPFISICFYTSKKEFLKNTHHLKPIQKIKDTKRIRK
jgi:hypothetical protein